LPRRQGFEDADLAVAHNGSGFDPGEKMSVSLSECTDQRQMNVPIFPASQQLVANRIEPLLTRQSLNAAQIKTLASLRDALLPKLISGELRVKGQQEGRTNAAESLQHFSEP
jgi:hypothetical protein